VLQSEIISLQQQPSVLLHFKFIRPGFRGSVERRIERNEDWNNSAEYRIYMEALGAEQMNLEFFDKEFSKKLEDVSSLNKFWLCSK